MKTIKELVLSAKNGNKKAFDKLYELTSNEVWFTCISLLKDEENAKDIMQETYITAFLKLDTLKDEEKFCGWLTAIATNKSKNKLKGKVEYQIDDEVLIAETETDELMLPEEYINKAEKRKVLLQIIEDTLSFNQYQVVLMFYFNELSIAEIAQALEISEGTVKSRLNSSRAKMKTAIEDYENKSGDRLHGVVFVPFFTTIFREQAKSLKVPSITITLPNGESLVTAASKGVSTAVKSSATTAVKAGAVTAVKTKAIAMACGITLLFAGTTVGTSLLAGCKSDKVPTATTSAQTTAQATTVPAVTVPKAVKDLVDKGEIKVDKDGNITDKKGKKVEVKDGKVEVKTDDGKTVTVKVDDVKTTVSNNNNSNKGNTEKREDTKKDNTSKTNTSDNDKKPASKPSNSSSNNQKPAKPSESSKAETTVKKYKYYKHHDAVTKYHPAVTKKHDREWIVTGTYEEPVYDYDWVNVCNDCGMQLTDANQEEHLTWEVRENGGRGSYHAEKQRVQVGTKTVEDGYWKEAYTEVVSKAWTETITPAYDEEVSENDHWDKKVPIN
ncbi:sigma-70 family RNA polymerase sigma factor [Ruminococcus bromii]|uniref:sigma-70 family RNA polymerase sigma factor n=1 Tax=Ruminococcus bromii TaxID=40518 RepID=UPI003AB7FCD1